MDFIAGTDTEFYGLRMETLRVDSSGRGSIKLISIIIPVYNTSKYLQRCLNSVLNQTYKDVEIIIINDGSTDNSLRICSEYAAKYDNIKLISKKNEGVSIARNTGIENATGDYIVFIDSDDYLENEYLQVLVNAVKGYDMACCAYYEDNGESRKAILLSDSCEMDQLKALQLEIGGDLFGGYLWNKIFRRSIIEKYKLRFKKGMTLCEDQVFCVEYTMHAQRIYYVAQALYHYIVYEDSALHSANRHEHKDLRAYKIIYGYSQGYDKNTPFAKTARKKYAVSLMAYLWDYTVTDRIDKKRRDEIKKTLKPLWWDMNMMARTKFILYGVLSDAWIKRVNRLYRKKVK